MLQTTAVVKTANASRYLQQLCKHWGHKFAVTFDVSQGRLELPFGTTELKASDDALTITIDTVDEAGSELGQKVVAVHLNRFAFREGELAFDWQITGSEG